nr:hypothetical protein Itr_chr01CG08330 [Ipomoea trifida]
MEVTHVVVARTGVLHGGESAADELRCSLAEEGLPPLARCHPPSETRGRGAVALPWKSSPFAAGKITRCPLEFAVEEREMPKGGNAIAATHHGHAPSSPTAAITILLGEKRRRGEGTAATRCSVLLLLLLREEDRRAKAAACSAVRRRSRGDEGEREALLAGWSHRCRRRYAPSLLYAKPPSPPSTAAPCFAEKTDGGYACCCRWNGVLHGGESAADELRCSLAEEGLPPLARCHPPSETRGRGAVALPWKSSPFAAGKITRCPLEFAVEERETPKGGNAIAATHHGHAPSSPTAAITILLGEKRRRGEGTAATRCSVLLLLLLREEDRRAKAAACSAVRRRSRGDEGEREALLAGWTTQSRHHHHPLLLRALPRRPMEVTHVVVARTGVLHGGESAADELRCSLAERRITATRPLPSTVGNTRERSCCVALEIFAIRRREDHTLPAGVCRRRERDAERRKRHCCHPPWSRTVVTNRSYHHFARRETEKGRRNRCYSLLCSTPIVATYAKPPSPPSTAAPCFAEKTDGGYACCCRWNGVLHGGESAADELRCSLAEEGLPPLARCHPPSETRGRGAVALPWKSSPFAAGKITRCPLEFAVEERETPKGGNAIAATHHGHAPSSPTAAITILLGEKRRRGEGTAATRCSVLLLLLLREEDRRAKAAACSAVRRRSRGDEGEREALLAGWTTQSRHHHHPLLLRALPRRPMEVTHVVVAGTGVLHGGESAADELRCSLAEEGLPPLARCHPPSETRGRGAVALPWKSSPFAAGKITRCPLEFAVEERETPKGGNAIAATHHGHAPSSPTAAITILLGEKRRRGEGTAATRCSVLLLLLLREEDRRAKAAACSAVRRRSRGDEGEREALLAGWTTQSRHHHHPLLLRALPRRPMEVTHVVVAGTGVLHGGESAADELRCSLAEEGLPPLARCHPPSETRGKGAVALPWKSSPFAAGKITRCPLEFAVEERETPKGGNAIAATHHGHAPSSPTAAITILLGEKRRRGEGTAATRCSVLLLLLLREEDRRAKAAACSAVRRRS